MKINNLLPLQRLIGKIDNDFNISDSDWIPRVAAWTIDALSQLKVLPMEHKSRKLDVVNRIAIFPCTLNTKNIEVYDSHGCPIPYRNKHSCCLGKRNTTEEEIGIFTGDEDYKTRVRVAKIVNPNSSHYFVTDKNNNIILNFDTDYITVKSFEVATYYDEYYNCEVPYIYDNGTLLEALCWYILFKYLSRGGKHTVYSLTAPNDVLNPFRQWMLLKDKAAASVKIDLRKDDSGWNNFFYNSTFLPRS